MSYSIDNLSFTIFGSGHDYTLLDSGKGEVQVFSHPFVPLNSLMYAGQWYFLVPDENGDAFDAVKDDLAHCTFTPALGAAFDTVGEITVECNYHREYIHDEETIVVDKTVSQVIEVVDHGTVQRAGGWNASKSCYCNSDIYTDGYCFIRPRNVNAINEDYVTVWDDSNITKLSSFPWRMTKLGTALNGCFKCPNLADIEELQYADTSRVTWVSQLFYYVTQVTDWSPISGWDMSNVTYMRLLLEYCSAPDLTFMADWNVSQVADMQGLLRNYAGASIHGIEDWDVSQVRDITYLLSQAANVVSLEPLLNWHITGITSLIGSFNSMKKITNLHGLENFDVSLVASLESTFYNDILLEDISAIESWNAKPTTMQDTFNDCSNLQSLHGVENIDVSNCTNFRRTFNNTWKCTSLAPVSGWDVSKGQLFDSMFGQWHWIESLDDIADWVFTAMTSATSMFYGNSALTDIDVPWVIPDSANISGMFTAQAYYYANDYGIYVYKTATVYIDYEGNTYGLGINATLIPKDASDAEPWTNGSDRGAFNTVWSNLPTWN